MEMMVTAPSRSTRTEFSSAMSASLWFWRQAYRCPLLDAIANEGNADGGIADRLMRVLEADPPRDDVFGVEVPTLDMLDAFRHFRAGVDAADAEGDADAIHVPQRHRCGFGEIAIHALADAVGFCGAECEQDGSIRGGNVDHDRKPP